MATKDHFPFTPHPTKRTQSGFDSAGSVLGMVNKLARATLRATLYRAVGTMSTRDGLIASSG
jgi:hypothetical protein